MWMLNAYEWKYGAINHNKTLFRITQVLFFILTPDQILYERKDWISKVLFSGYS